MIYLFHKTSAFESLVCLLFQLNSQWGLVIDDGWYLCVIFVKFNFHLTAENFKVADN